MNPNVGTIDRGVRIVVSAITRTSVWRWAAPLIASLCLVACTALPPARMALPADLEAAIQAGSTMVRVGTGIFGVRPRPAA